MPGNLKNDQSGNYAVELKRALQDRVLQELLQGEIGPFTIRYLFINEYVGYVTLKKSNPAYRPANETAKSIRFNKIFALIKEIARKKNNARTDFLFVSRDRQVKAKVKSGYLTGDYIFYSVIDELARRCPGCKHHVYIIDNSYDKYYYANLADIAGSIYSTTRIYFKWIYYNKVILKRLDSMNCSHVSLMASNFFQLRMLLRIVLMGYSMARMFSQKEPKVIVSNDDCLYTRPLNSDAKMVVLQSARMADYLEECKELIFEEHGLKPEFFLSSGRNFAKLKERNNEAESVLITGLPRYDVLSNASEIYSRTGFFNAHAIDINSKIILWTTQCHAVSEEENIENFQAVFRAIKDLQGITLIIKQHPAEGKSYTEKIRRYIEDYQINYLIAPKDADTYELLFISDLVVAKASTTVMEAVALNKPVIILNLSGEPDPVEYVQEGVALGIYTKDELISGIKRLLSDDSELASNRARYVENYLYKMDGLATDRVVSLLVKLANV
jgi:hypothetical protein